MMSSTGTHVVHFPGLKGPQIMQYIHANLYWQKYGHIQIKFDSLLLTLLKVRGVCVSAGGNIPPVSTIAPIKKNTHQ